MVHSAHSPTSSDPSPLRSDMTPSPASSLNASAVVGIPSPANEDVAYTKKIKELQKYEVLLQWAIAKIENKDLDKASQIKELLEILTNPNHRVSMEYLLKFESALKKMERETKLPKECGCGIGIRKLEIKQLKTKLKEKEKVIKRLTNKTAKKVSKLETQLINKNATIDQLKAIIEDMNEKYSLQNNQIRSLKSHNKFNEQKMKKLQDSFETIQGTLNETFVVDLDGDEEESCSTNQVEDISIPLI